MDLSLIPFEDLVEEIKDRFDIVVWAGIKEKSDDDSLICYRSRGTVCETLGLTSLLKDHIVGNYKEDIEAVSNEDI